MTYEYEIRWLTRELDRMEARDETLSPGWSTAYPVKSFEDRKLRVRAYYLESCLTALVAEDPLVGLRAACQAFSYSGEDWGDRALGALACGERDVLMTIRNRYEDMLRPRD